MAEIRRVLWLRHLRSEPSVHMLRYRRGALAAQEFAGKLDTIEHLNISPELLAPLLRLAENATRPAGA